ncbi:hypothetical protein PVAP13_8KG261901 [Panicum virgatum]|uniref:Uncharacterized protein n=1 Tax=Panicum virgatum TaxID=38727 RepID=A0A8T0PKE4_PANVG|nr:hypothetical protein PVAP13_8KG261901 [Panicum virgatum]
MENDEPQPPLAAFVIEPIDISTNRDRILGSTNKRRPPKLGRSRDPPSSARCAARSVAPLPGSAPSPAQAPETSLPGHRSCASSPRRWDLRRHTLTRRLRRCRDAGAARALRSPPPGSTRPRAHMPEPRELAAALAPVPPGSEERERGWGRI